MRIARKRKLSALVVSVLASVGLLVAAAPASADDAVWRMDSLANSFAQAGGTHRIILQLGNVGDGGVDGTAGDPIRFTAALSEEMAVQSITVPSFFGAADWNALGWQCSGDGPGGAPGIVGAQNVSCAIADRIEGHQLNLMSIGRSALPVISVAVDGEASGALTSRFTLSGGGAVNEARTAEVTRISSSPVAGIDSFDVTTTDDEGRAYTQAAGHPYAYTTEIDFNTGTNPLLDTGSGPQAQDAFPIESAHNVVVDLPPGFIGNPAAAVRCDDDQLPTNRCPIGSQVGTALVRLNGLFTTNLIGPFPVYNVEPSPGEPARFGFVVYGVLVTMKARLRSESDYGISIIAPKLSQGLDVAGTTLTIWGNPTDPRHDFERHCPGEISPEYLVLHGPSCESSEDDAAFLRMPASCTGQGEGMPWSMALDTWDNMGPFLPGGRPDLSDPAWATASIEGHEAPGYPLPPSDWGVPKNVGGCAGVPVKADLSAQPTALDTETPTGLEVHLEVPNPGLENPTAIASSDLRKVEVTLPEGVTINPSQAEGLGVCTPSQYESSELSFHPDGTKGCPSDSKIGTVAVKTPLLEETIPGNVYIAKPYDNPFGSLLALYVVLEEPQRGILIKVAGEVELDERTGQITAVFDDLPQVPFSTMDFKFREGARAPLVTPSSCGTYTTEAKITGWSNPANPITSSSSFQITRGIGGAACPSGGLPPFKPGLIAGSLNNNAGSYSPFYARLFRNDGEQEITHFSIKLPPGLSGKLAGVPFCPDAAIAAAKWRSGSEELASPSCPLASRIGHTKVGAGVGSVLAYAPGELYLAGPYNGSPLSIVAITAAKVGPFDLGTVVVREALAINPETAEVFVDATGSDPIPRIIKGVTTHLRDIRIYVDRPEFALNPTSCDRTSTASTLLGYGLDFASEADDVPVTVTTPYQAANCANLAFKPKLAMRLLGGTHRGDFPALRAVLTMKPGQANIARAQVTLPHSEFLAQSHIRTVCTRVQFAADACPQGSIYGRATAITPLLDEPLSGPVYLRSNGGERQLPDLVAALHSGRIDIHLVGFIDSVGKSGRIRTTFQAVPDAPVSKFVLRMQGGKKGLLENSADLCRARHRARVEFDGHNGKIHDVKPLLRVNCKRGGKR